MGRERGDEQWTKYTLLPRSSFNFGGKNIGAYRRLGIYPSDSLFSALCLQLRELHGQCLLEEMLDDFNSGDPPFVLSCLLPSLGPIQLLPRPACPPKIEQTRQASGLDHRAFRRLEWLSQLVFDDWVCGSTSLDFGSQCTVAQGGTILLTNEEHKQAANVQGLLNRSQSGNSMAWDNGTRLRTATGRDGKGVRSYARRTTRFGAGVRLCILVQWHGDKGRDVIEQSLAALGDAGVGADRNIGLGHFSIESVSSQPRPKLAGADGLISLSLFCPTYRELAGCLLRHPGAAWILVERGGRASSPEAAGRRRRCINMLGAGSVVALIDSPNPFLGRMVDVTPEPRPGHRVWRNGLSLGWPTRLISETKSSLTT